MGYCMECGTELQWKFLENEGEIPFCSTCQEYRFPLFNVAVSVIVLNPTQDKVMLIQQYNKKDYILVAGYVNKGESAEESVSREVKEELGLTIHHIQPNKTSYFDKTNTLMLNFSCIASNENFTLTEEVDLADWFSLDEALANIKPESIAKDFLSTYIEKKAKME